MGSSRFVTQEVAGFEFTDAWFPPGARLPPHIHERTVLAVVVQGGIQSVLGRRTLRCRTNDVWTEPAGDRHANTVEAAGARVLVIQPDPSKEALEPARRFLEAIHHFPSPPVAALARRAIPEIRSSDPLAQIQLEGLALELLAAAARIGPEPVRPLPGGFTRAVDRLHDEFRSRVTVGDLASEAGLHPSYFAKLFRRHTGSSVGEYVRELRVQWASEQMVRGTDLLGRIALRAGFSDQSHFNRTFKRARGMTPSEYRATVTRRRGRDPIHPREKPPVQA